jgi:hypothetical protein
MKNYVWMLILSFLTVFSFLEGEIDTLTKRMGNLETRVAIIEQLLYLDNKNEHR